eukprot:6191033-Pleurochrysis_carterae.AAC.1
MGSALPVSPWTGCSSLWDEFSWGMLRIPTCIWLRYMTLLISSVVPGWPETRLCGIAGRRLLAQGLDR